MKPESFEDLVAKIVELDSRVSALENREAPTPAEAPEPKRHLSSGDKFRAVRVTEILDEGKKK
jgi:hypothetical protein